MVGSSIRPDQQTPGAALRLSAYDRFASLLISLLMLVGGVVLFLFIAWLSTRGYKVEKAVPVTVIDVGGGREDGVEGQGMQIESPNEGAVVGDSDPFAVRPAETLAALIDSAQVPTTEIDELDQKLDRTGNRVGAAKSEGSGLTGPSKGTGGGSGGGVGRVQCWEIRLPEGNSVESYARQLDTFKIELGLLAPDKEIIYLSNLTAQVPTKRTGPRAEEQRKPMSWTRGDLMQADFELFQRAGLDVERRHVLKFLPQETVDELARLEKEFKNRAVKEIRRTRFGIKPEGVTFVFYVIDQTYF